MKRVLAWLMMTLLLLSLTACGSSKNESLEGTWKWTMDVTDQIFKENKITEIDTVEMVYVLTFRRDGSFSMAVDKAALYQSLQSCIDTYIDAIIEQGYQEMAASKGITREQFDAIMTDKGLTWESYMKLTLLSQGDPYKVADSVAGDSMSGYFRSDGSRLHVSKQKDSFDRDNYTEYSLGGDVMTWTGGDSGPIGTLEDAGAQLPVKWVRQ